MRSFLSWFVTLWLCALPLAAQPSTSTDTAPAVAAHGTLLVVVLAGRRLAFLPGVTVSASGVSAETNAHGTAALLLPEGEHSASLAIAGKQIALPTAGVFADDDTLVLVTLSDDGKLVEATVQLPKPSAAATPEAAPASAAATPTEPVAGSTEQSALVGRIVSTAGGKPIAGASVYVLGTALEAQSDSDGRFTLPLDPGTYAVSVVQIEHTGQTLEGIIVKAGTTTELRIELTPAPLEMESFVVRARRIQGTAATVLEDRRKSAAVTDAIGAEDIRKSADGTASAATRRIVGASVVGGQFLFVRGLGGRYSNVRLNGIPLPSTDPDLPGFQLDLFPASLLSSLTISKTFTPDIPGDFAGGSMNVVTRDFPTRFDLSASLGVSSDSETLGKDILSYRGGGLDWLGIDDGTRALPDAVPKQAVKRPGLNDDEIVAVGRAFPDVWEPETGSGLPNVSLGFSVGNTLRPNGHRVGLLFTLGYRYNVSHYIESLTTQNAEGPTQTLSRDMGSSSAQTGVLGTASYELATGHNLTLVSLLTQTGDDQASLITGFSEAENQNMRRTSLRFVERRLLFDQLLGKHDLGSLELDWQLNVSNIERDQPDTRNLAYFEGPTGYLFKDVGGSGDRLYTNLGETGLGGGTDITVPIADAKLQAGYLGNLSNRDYTLRRFGTTFRGKDSEARALDPEELLAPENSGVLWLIAELTGARDGYEAKQTLHAGYASADVPLASFLRLTGGARVEAFGQKIDPVSPAEGLTTGRAEKVDRSDLDALPAASAIVSLSDSMSVRFAYGGTVARPLLRELSPSPIPDFVRRRTIQGNPDLKRTYIHNFDLRWEAFPGATEVLAASAFYKVFQDPIEPMAPDPSQLTFDNVPSAKNYGLELEARAGLERLSDALEGLVLTANLALIHSQVELSEAQVMQLTSQKRPLAGQSPYIINLALAYTIPRIDLALNLLYNAFGRRIAEVGVAQLPDVYELPFHSLDFTASYPLGEHFTLAASATNLLLQETVMRQGHFDFSRIDRGVGFGLRLGYAN